MKKSLLLLLLSVISSCVFSQVITGKVYDIRTKEPIAGASVYLDGTSNFTLTDKKGDFKLNPKKLIHTNLVISYVLYEPAIIQYPYKQIADSIFLKEKDNLLNEAMVFTDPFSRTQKLKAFRTQFLGKTKAGRSCKIRNEDDINVAYNPVEKKLIAFSDVPIVVENKYLGFRVFYNLMSFEVSYSVEESLHDSDIKQSVFYGTCNFMDKAPKKLEIKERRNDSYKKSSAHFFKNLAYDILDSTDYKLNTKRGRQIKPKDFFVIKDSLYVKHISILPDSDLISTNEYDKHIFGAFGLRNSGVGKSEVIFFTPSFFVDEYGNTNELENIMFTGLIARNRLGDMLPLDYVLEEDESEQAEQP